MLGGVPVPAELVRELAERIDEPTPVISRRRLTPAGQRSRSPLRTESGSSAPSRTARMG
jgi:hypothetical protein